MAAKKRSAHQKVTSKKPSKPKRTKVDKKPTDQTPLGLRLFDQISNKSTWIFFALLILGCVVLFQDFFSKELIFLFSDIGSDSVNLKYPRMALYEWLKDSNIDIHGWNHYMGMGTPDADFELSTWRTVINAPLLSYHWLMYQIAGLIGFDKLPYHIIWKQFSETLLMGAFAFLWLRSLNVKGLVALLGGLSIVFSGYVVLGNTWYHSGFNFLFFLFAFEQFFEKKRWYFLPFAFILFGSYQYWFITLFTVFYGTTRFFMKNEKFIWSRFLKFSGGVIGLCALGLALNFPVLIDQFEKITNSPRGEGMFGSKKVSSVDASLTDKLSDYPVLGTESSIHYQSALLRSYDPDILGSGNKFTGWRNYLEAPAFSSSILFMLLLPMLFFVFKGRQRIVLGSFLGIWILFTLFPYLRYAFYFFVGDYYKQALNYFVPFSFVFLGVLTLNEVLKEKELKWFVPALSTVIMLILLNLPFESNAEVNQGIKAASAGWLVFYGALLTLTSFKKYRYVAILLMLVALPIELFSRGYRMLDDRESLEAVYFETKRGYNDYSVDAVKWIQEQDSSFYRIEKNFGSAPSIHSSINDGQAQHYFGTQSYSSFNNAYYIRFLGEMNFIQSNNEVATRWAPGLRYAPILHGPFGVRYTMMAPRYQLNNQTLGNMKQNGVPNITLQNFLRNSRANGQSMVMNRGDFEHYLRTVGGANFDQWVQQALNSCIISGPDFRQFGYQVVNQIEDVMILENPMAMPFGVVYKQVIKESDLKDLDATNIQIAYYYAAVIPDTSESSIPVFHGDSIPGQVTFQELSKISEDIPHVQWTSWDEAYVTWKGEIALDKPGWLFFSVPFDERWVIEVDGQRVQNNLTHFGFLGTELQKGEHSIALSFE